MIGHWLRRVFTRRNYEVIINPDINNLIQEIDEWAAMTDFERRERWLYTMTRDKIVIPNGQELDAAVAEHVMGSPPGSDSRYWPISNPPRATPFSHDIGHAWAVVTHMNTLGYRWAFHQHGDAAWTVTLTRFDTPWTRSTSHTEAALPEAICRAALMEVNRE